MQIQVKVKVPKGLFRQISLAVKDATKKGLHVAAEYARDRILTEANKQLSPEMAREYYRGLSESSSLEIKDRSAVIRLGGDMATSIENGFPSFSIKDAMLAKATKHTKDGRPMVDVPFEHGTASHGAAPPGLPKPVARMIGAALGAVPAAVRNRRAMRLSIPTQALTVRKTLHPGGERILVKHKVGIYDSMLRIPLKRGATAMFLTIRRISSKSSPASWIHPGSQGAHIFDRVRGDIEKTAGKIIGDTIKEELKRGR